MVSTIRTLIVDDDPMFQKVLKKYLDRHDKLEHVTTCDDAIQAANVLQEENVDLVFLDVEMPDMSGLELVDSLDAPPSIVMVTGKEKYAVDAFEAAVTDYLVKPVRYSRFLQAVSRVEDEMTKEAKAQAKESPDLEDEPDVRVARSETDDADSPDHVFLKVDRRLIRVHLSDIQWIEAQGDYMMVQAGPKRYLIHSTLKELDEKLPSDQFVRVHRSYIVRIDQIKDIEDTTLVIDGEVIPIGGSYYETLIDRIQTL